MSGNVKATARSPYYLRSREQKIPTDFSQGLTLTGATNGRAITRRPLQHVQPKKDENEDSNISVIPMDSIDSRVFCGKNEDMGLPASPASSSCTMDIEQSTPPAPMPQSQQLTQEMEISAEESRLAGAPRGPIYTLPVPGRSELLAIAEGTGESLLNTSFAMVQSAGDEDWAKRHEAIICFRRLADDEGSRALVQGALMESLVHVIDAVKSERSAIARNSLMCATEFLEHFGSDSSASDAWEAHMENLVEALLHRSAGGPKFVCAAANTALETAVKHVDAAKLCLLLRKGLGDRNPDVSGNAVRHIEGCLAKLGVEKMGSDAEVAEGESKDTESELPSWATALVDAGYPLEELTLDMAQHCHARSETGRHYSRLSLQRLRMALGIEQFSLLLRQSLASEAQVQAVLKSTASKRKAGVMSGNRQAAARLVATGTRISLKDRILAAQRAVADGSGNGMKTPVVDRSDGTSLHTGVNRIDRQRSNHLGKEPPTR